MLTTTYKGKRGRFVTLLGTPDFLARPILPRNRTQFMEKKKKKKEKQIFSKIVRANKLKRQRTQQMNNDHFDRSCCQHLQEATKKTFSFTVN